MLLYGFLNHSSIVAGPMCCVPLWLVMDYLMLHYVWLQIKNRVAYLIYIFKMDSHEISVNLLNLPKLKQAPAKICSAP